MELYEDYHEDSDTGQKILENNPGVDILQVARIHITVRELFCPPADVKQSACKKIYKPLDKIKTP